MFLTVSVDYSTSILTWSRNASSTILCQLDLRMTTPLWSGKPEKCKAGLPSSIWTDEDDSEFQNHSPNCTLSRSAL